MPNAPEHRSGAIALNLLYWLMSPYRTNPAMLVISSIPAILGGATPDTLEPATSPRHRGFWHYIGGPATILPAVSLMTSTNPSFLLGSYFVGYFSHWLLDVTT